MVTCTSCGELIQESSSGRLPPWCLSCGASVASGTKTIPAESAPVQERTASPDVGTPAPQPSSWPSEDFDDTSPIGVFNFSFAGYLHKLGPGFLLAGIFG